MRFAELAVVLVHSTTRYDDLFAHAGRQPFQAGLGEHAGAFSRPARMTIAKVGFVTWIILT
mgnify:CR=1 FL=1